MWFFHNFLSHPLSCWITNQMIFQQNLYSDENHPGIMHTYFWNTDLPQFEGCKGPIEIYYLYRDRAECENWIEHAKNQLSAGTTRLNSFKANVILWQLAIYAYNLTIWLRYLCADRKYWRQEPATFRRWFINIAGNLVYTARQFYLNMQKFCYYKNEWLKIYKNIIEIQL